MDAFRMIQHRCRGSHGMNTSQCLALNNRMLLYFIRVSPLNDIITTREWEETQSASVLFSLTSAVFHVSAWLWHNWAVIQHECTLKNKVTFRINWMAKMSACFSQFHDFPNYNLPSAWNSWSILFQVLFTFTQIPRVLYPSLCKHLSNMSNTIYNLYAWLPSVWFAVNLSIKAVVKGNYRPSFSLTAAEENVTAWKSL